MPGCDTQALADAHANAEPDGTLPTPNFPQNAVPPVTCATFQQTRLYNRSKWKRFKYGILSFDWDSVINPSVAPYQNIYDPQNPNVGYPLFFSKMDEATMQVEAYNTQSAAPTHRLYIDNRDSRTGNNQSQLCGRHVVTNQRAQNITSVEKRIEDTHYDFVTKMIAGSNWTDNILSLQASECPINQSE